MTSLEFFTILFTQNTAKTHMFKTLCGEPACLSSCCVYHFEMVVLTIIGNIDCPIGFKHLQSVLYGSHISGVIIVTSIRFDYYQRNLIFLQEDTFGFSSILCWFIFDIFLFIILFFFGLDFLRFLRGLEFRLFLFFLWRCWSCTLFFFTLLLFAFFFLVLLLFTFLFFALFFNFNSFLSLCIILFNHVQLVQLFQ